MKILFRTILVILIVGIVAMLTKPSDESCKSKASTGVEKYLKGEVNSDLAFVNRLIEKVSEDKVWVDDKLFYKEIKFSYKGNTKTVGYGYFGYVHIKDL